MNFRNLSLRAKLLLIAFAGVLSCVVVGVACFASMSTLGAAERAVSEDATPSLLIVGDLG